MNQEQLIDALRAENERLRDALRVIAEALKEPDGGSYWPAREYLDKFDVFHDDLSGTRVLERVASAALLAAESTQPAPDQKGKL
jgi:hypothetical protein